MGKFIIKALLKIRFLAVQIISRISPRQKLTKLADKHGSDKGTEHARKHNYTRIYDKLFKPLLEKEISILEIGLQYDPERKDCPSLAMWSEYFPKARIYGFDIKDFSFVKLPRTRIFQGNQGKKEDLERFIRDACSSFDIIIDDGSHAPHHQQITLAHLFPRLKSGGYYIIEDLHWVVKDISDEPDYSAEKYTLTKEIFKEYIKSGRLESNVMDQEESRGIAENIKECRFYSSQSPGCQELDHKHSLLVIVKK